jgi:uncharacterized membrane protein
MIHLPRIPSWNGVHLLIVHVSIVLLLIAPLLVMVGTLLSPPKRSAFLVTAFILMVLGTGSVLIAVETGKAAGKLLGSTPLLRAILQQHRELAGTTQVLFSALTMAFAPLLFVPRLLRRELGPGVNAALLAAFLLFYTTGALFLVNTAHLGRRLVQELGVTAPVASSPVATAASGD